MVIDKGSGESEGGRNKGVKGYKVSVIQSE